MLIWWRGRLERCRSLCEINIGRRRGYMTLTLARFELGPVNGVPSLFSTAFPLFIGRDSSRRGRTFKSAYFRQVIPHVSHKILAGRPLGAFHHVLDSRVRQAAQILLVLLMGSLKTDPSSSAMPTICRPPSIIGWRVTGSFTVKGPFLRVRAFSSPSLALAARLVLPIETDKGQGKTDFFQCP